MKSEAASIKCYFATLLLLYMLTACGCSQEASYLNIPEFNLILSDGSTFNTTDIPAGNPIVMVYYDGECDNCHDEAEEIMERIDELENVKFYFITVEPMEEAKRFVERLQIDRFENIIVGTDTGRYFPYYLQANSTPVLALYDKRKRLRGVFADKPPIDTLIAKIHDL